MQIIGRILSKEEMFQVTGIYLFRASRNNLKDFVF